MARPRLDAEPAPEVVDVGWAVTAGMRAMRSYVRRWAWVSHASPRPLTMSLPPLGPDDLDDGGRSAASCPLHREHQPIASHCVITNRPRDPHAAAHAGDEVGSRSARPCRRRARFPFFVIAFSGARPRPLPGVSLIFRRFVGVPVPRPGRLDRASLALPTSSSTAELTDLQDTLPSFAARLRRRSRVTASMPPRAPSGRRARTARPRRPG